MSDRKKISAPDLHELASLYALGALDAGDRIAFEEHLRQGCDACAQDLSSFTDVADLIGESVSATPPQQLRQRLLSRVSHSPRIPGILLEQGGF